MAVIGQIATKARQNHLGIAQDRLLHLPRMRAQPRRRHRTVDIIRTAQRNGGTGRFSGRIDNIKHARGQKLGSRPVDREWRDMKHTAGTKRRSHDWDCS